RRRAAAGAAWTAPARGALPAVPPRPRARRTPRCRTPPARAGRHARRIEERISPPHLRSAARVIGGNLRVDVDPHRFRFGVVMHGFEPHLAPVSRAGDAPEGRARIDPLVAV